MMSLMGLLVAGCTTGSPPPSGPTPHAPEPTANADVTFDLRLPDHPDTALYILAGPAPLSYDVYRVIPETGQVERLTWNPPGFGISHVSATDDQVVLADARTGQDELVTWEADRRTALPMAAGSRGFAPGLHPDGRLLHLQLVAHAEPPHADRTFEVVVRAHPTAPARVVYQSTTHLSATWGPDGRIAVAVLPGREQPDGPSRLLLVDPETTDTTPLRGYPDWSSIYLVGHPDSPYLTVVNPRQAATGFLHTGTGEWAPMPPGWVGLCPDPSGHSVLVTRDQTLGLVSPTDPDQVHVVGQIHAGSVGLCSWIRQTA